MCCEVSFILNGLDHRDWVAVQLKQMNSLNKAEADAEMKTLISEAYTNQTLWTTDWAGVQLKA